MFLKSCSVFALAIVEFGAALPLGLHLEMHPTLVGVVSLAGAFVGILLATFAGEAIRKLIFWRRADTAKTPSKISKWLMEKGPWAIGLLGPGLIGPLFAAGLAASIGLPRRRSMALLAVGVTLWAGVFIVAANLGLDYFGKSPQAL